MIAWWHWLPDVWFVIDHGISPSAEKWRELVRAHLPDQPHVGVICVEAADALSAFVPAAGHQWFSESGWGH